MGIDNNKPTIWFNSWFSALAVTLKSVRHAFGDQVNILVSHKNKLCAYKPLGDKFILEEEKVSAHDYVEWALQVCKDNNVKLFIPKRFMEDIALNAGKFQEIGTKVLTEEYSIINHFDSKAAIYKELETIGYRNIPYYKLVNSKKDFIDGDNDIFDMGGRACIKYDHDEGANSFRVLEHCDPTIESLSSTLMNTMQYSDAEAMVGRAEAEGKLKPLIMMEILNGPEVSVDCYNSKQFGFIAIPRFKMGNRIKEIRMNNAIIEDAKRLQETYKFKSVWNVQYRWDKQGNLRLLEVNTRMSGGIHLSSMAGFSIPLQWIAEALGLESPNKHPKYISDCIVTQYETPVILK